MSVPYENVKAFVDGMNHDLFYKYAKAVGERQKSEAVVLKQVETPPGDDETSLD